MSNTISFDVYQLLHKASRPGLRSTVLANGQEFRLVRGLTCPACHASLHCYDAASIDATSFELICRNGHYVLQYGKRSASFRSEATPNAS